jgi:hypothetical protein
MLVAAETRRRWPLPAVLKKPLSQYFSEGRVRPAVRSSSLQVIRRFRYPVA